MTTLGLDGTFPIRVLSLPLLAHVRIIGLRTLRRDGNRVYYLSRCGPCSGERTDYGNKLYIVVVMNSSTSNQICEEFDSGSFCRVAHGCQSGHASISIADPIPGAFIVNVGDMVK